MGPNTNTGFICSKGMWSILETPAILHTTAKLLDDNCWSSDLCEWETMSFLRNDAILARITTVYTSESPYKQA